MRTQRCTARVDNIAKFLPFNRRNKIKIRREYNEEESILENFALLPEFWIGCSTRQLAVLE